MASGRLLDTNVLIKMINGDYNLTKKIATLPNVFIPVTAYGELMFGAEKSSKPEPNKIRLQTFCADFIMLNTTREVGNTYGKLKSDLQKLGKLIPENDMWIAATALAFDLIVVTNDKHFGRVPHLQIESI